MTSIKGKSSRQNKSYREHMTIENVLRDDMFAYDKTFDPEVVLGHCDLISRFSDFALYLGTQMVYEQTSFKLCLGMTRPLTLK